MVHLSYTDNMENSEIDKLQEAIMLLVHRRLKTNSDDTYPQKLFDHVELIKDFLPFEVVSSLLDQILQSLSTYINDQPSPNNTSIDLSISLIIMGSLLSKSGVLDARVDIIDQCLAALRSISKLLKIENWDQVGAIQDLSIKNSYLKCLAMICKSFTGTLWLCRNDTILITVFHLMTSSSFYVVQEASLVMQRFLSTAFTSANDDLIRKCDPFIHQMLLVNSSPRLDCIRALLRDPDIRPSFIRLYQLDLVLPKKVDFKDSKHDAIFYDCLAYVLKTSEMVEETVSKLVKYKNLQSIIVLYRRLMDLNSIYVEKWHFYCCTALGYKVTDLKCPDLAQLFSSSPIKEALGTVINSIDLAALRSLSEDQLIQLTESMMNYIKYHSKGEFMRPNRKLISEILTKINNTVVEKAYTYPKLILSIVENLSFLNTESDQSGQCEILKILRSLLSLDSQPPPEATDIQDQVHRIILVDIEKILDSDIQTNASVIDSALEVLTELLKVICSRSDTNYEFPSSLCISVLRIYQTSQKSHAFFDLTAPCLPFVLHLALTEHKSVLSILEIHQMYVIDDICHLIISGDYYIQMQCIKAVQINQHLIGKKLICKIFISLAILIVNQIDSEFIDGVLSIWGDYLQMIEKKLRSDADDEDILDLMLCNCYTAGVFHALHAISTCDYTPNAARIKALNLQKVIFYILDNKYDRSCLIEKLSNLEQPCLRYIEEEDISSAVEKAQLISTDSEFESLRERVLEDIFKGGPVPPTQDLLQSLSEQFETRAIRRKPLKMAPCEVMADFLLQDPEDIAKNYSQSFSVEYKLNILDDIIAAKDFTSNQALDCY